MTVLHVDVCLSNRYSVESVANGIRRVSAEDSHKLPISATYTFDNEMPSIAPATTLAKRFMIE